MNYVVKSHQTLNFWSRFIILNEFIADWFFNILNDFTAKQNIGYSQLVWDSNLEQTSINKIMNEQLQHNFIRNKFNGGLSIKWYINYVIFGLCNVLCQSYILRIKVDVMLLYNKYLIDIGSLNYILWVVLCWSCWS